MKGLLEGLYLSIGYSPLQFNSYFGQFFDNLQKYSESNEILKQYCNEIKCIVNYEDNKMIQHYIAPQLSLQYIDQITPLTLAVIFLFYGRRHADDTISFELKTFDNLLKYKDKMTADVKIFFDKSLQVYRDIELNSIFVKLNWKFLEYISEEFQKYEFLQPYLNLVHPELKCKNTFTLKFKSIFQIDEQSEKEIKMIDADICIEDFINYRTNQLINNEIIDYILQKIYVKFENKIVNDVHSSLKINPSLEMMALFILNLVKLHYPHMTKYVKISDGNYSVQMRG